MANASSVSTRVVWKPVKITQRPAGPEKGRRRRPPRPFLPRREWRQNLSLQVAYRGGSEPLVEIRARGRVWHVTGHENFLDVLIDIWDGDEF